MDFVTLLNLNLFEAIKAIDNLKGIEVRRIVFQACASSRLQRHVNVPGLNLFDILETDATQIPRRVVEFNTLVEARSGASILTVDGESQRYGVFFQDFLNQLDAADEYAINLGDIPFSERGRILELQLVGYDTASPKWHPKPYSASNQDDEFFNGLRMGFLHFGPTSFHVNLPDEQRDSALPGATHLPMQLQAILATRTKHIRNGHNGGSHFTAYYSTEDETQEFDFTTGTLGVTDVLGVVRMFGTELIESDPPLVGAQHVDGEWRKTSKVDADVWESIGGVSGAALA